MADNATTIDSLQIQIEATASTAEKGLEELKKSLESLKSMLGSGSGLSGVAKQLETIGTKTEELGTNAALGIDKLVKALQELKGVGKLNLTDTSEQIGKVSEKSEKAAVSLNKSTVRLGVALASLKGIGTTIARLIDKSNSYVENLNLFNASLGKYASSAQEYAQQVADLMGIDPSQWLRTQGVFQTLAVGFGVTSDRAIIMSKNLTQLGYDLSSFFNIAVEGEGSAMQKLQAAFSGELEPLRRLGFDLSEARLKAVALSLGIDQTFNSMTQAQKAQLRYYAILTQVTTAQGDMARTLDTPANQLRIFKAQVEQAGRALGNIFIPALNAILPYCIAATQAIRMVADALAAVVGFKLPEIDYSGVTGATDAVDDLDASLTSAGGSAKKLKDLLADFDELNIIQSDSASGGKGSGKTAYNAEDWTFDLPEYDFLKEFTQSRVSQILESWKPTIQWITDHMKQISRVIAAIGSSFLAWKISDKLLPGLGEAAGYLELLLGAVGVLTTVTGSIALNISFTTEWLTNGNWGSLFGEFITSISATSLVAAIVKHVVKGEKGAKMADWAAGTLLTINGAIGLILSIKNAMVKGLNEKNMLRMLTGGAELAGGVALIYRQIASWISGSPASKAQSIGAGAIAFFAAANVGLNLALTEGYLVSGDPIKILESVGTDALTAAGIGAAAKLTFKSNKAGFIASGIALAADAAMDLWLTVGKVAENGLTEENIMAALKSTMEGAIAAGLITSYALKDKFDLGTAAEGGGAALIAGIGIALNAYISHAAVNSEGFVSSSLISGGALISDAITAYLAGGLIVRATNNEAYGWAVGGVTLGIDAIVTTVNVYDKIKESGQFDSATAGAALKSIVETALAGAAIGMSVGQPLPGFLVGLGIAISLTAIATLAALENHTTAIPEMKYGENTLTPEEVQAYVNSLYELDVTAKVNTITPVVDASTKIKTEVSQSFEELQSELKILKMGVDPNSYNNIKNMLTGENGLIFKLNKLMESETAAIKLWVTIGANDTSKLATNIGTILTADELITNELTWAGEQFAKLITDGMDKQLGEEEAKMRDSLLEFITNVTSAALQGQAQGQFEASVAALHLKDMSQASISDVLSKYSGYAQDLWDSLTNLQTETLAGLYSKRATYQTAIDDWQKLHPGETAPKELTDAVAALDIDIKDLKDNWDINLHKAYDPMVAAGNTQLFDEIWGMILSDNTLNKAISDRFEKYSYQISEYQTDAGDVLDQFISEVVLDVMSQYTNGGFSSWQTEFEKMGMGDMFSDMLTSMTMSALKQDVRYAWMYENFDLPTDIQSIVKPQVDNTEFNEQIEATKTTFSEAITDMNEAGVVGINIVPVVGDSDVSGGSSSNYPAALRGPENPYYVGTFAAQRVDTITQSTAVPSDEQTQSNIAAGVSSGNKDQVELLKTQNMLLRQILAKTGTVVPSTALGRTIKRSSELLAAVEGVASGVTGFTFP